MAEERKDKGGRRRKPLLNVEKGLQRLIADETAQIRVALTAAEARIRSLENRLSRIAGIAGNPAVIEPTPEPVKAIAIPHPPVAVNPEPEAPQVELNGADNLGEGRWL